MGTDTIQLDNQRIKLEESCLSQPMRNCLVLSISFSFAYTSYSTLVNLQSSLNGEANLGIASLAVMGGSVVVCSTISPLLAKKIGAKTVLILAWIFFTLYTAGNFYPSWPTLIPTAALMGASVGPLWTCKDLYLAANGDRYAKLQVDRPSDKDHHSALSKLGGVFYMFYHMTDIGGNLISSLVLTTGIDTNTSQSMNFDLCGANNCPWTDYSNGNPNTTGGFIQPERHVVYILLGVLQGFNVCGLLLTIFALPSLEQAETSRKSLTCKNSLSCLRMIINPAMVPLIPIFMSEQVLNAILASDYTKAFISCTKGVQWIGFILASYGVLCTVSAFSVNQLARYLGRPFMFVSGILLAIAAFVMMLTWQPTTNDDLSWFFIIPIIAGLSQGTLNPQKIAIVAHLFNDQISEGYAVLIGSKAIAFTLAFTLSLFVCLRPRLVLALLVYVVSLAGYVWTEFQIKRKSRSGRN